MKFIAALNSINSQVWAFLVLITGCASVLAFHKSGIDIGIAAGIIGVGANMFQSAMKIPAAPPPVNPIPPVEPAQPTGA